MPVLNVVLTGAGLALLGYGLFTAWPPLAALCAGAFLLRVAWALDEGGSR